MTQRAVSRTGRAGSPARPQYASITIDAPTHPQNGWEIVGWIAVGVSLGCFAIGVVQRGVAR